MISAYVVICLLFNQTQCRELELIVYEPIRSPYDCAIRAALTNPVGGVVDQDGQHWVVHGVRCKMKPLTEIQKRLRAAVTP